MNKAFKVLWNQVRGTYVVASEAQVTHGKPGKAKKTIVAAAVAGLLAAGGSVLAAEPITNASFGEGGQYNSTKFVSGHGGTITIQTSGDARELFKALKSTLQDPSSENIKNLLNALGTGNGATLVGFAGGSNVSDYSLAGVLGMVSGKIAEKLAPNDEQLQKQIQNGLSRVAAELQYVDEERTLKIDEDTHSHDVTSQEDINIVIGGDVVEPLLIGSVGADRLINSSIKLQLAGQVAGDPFDASLTRKNNVTVTADSGNLIGFVGGSSAINLKGISAETSLGSIPVSATLQGNSTKVTLDGKTEINLNGSTTSAGVLAGGSAIAIGGSATSIVTGTSKSMWE